MQNESHPTNSPLSEAAHADLPADQASSSPLDLKTLRESQRMSIGDAAYALKVSPRVIEALEAGQWATLPGRTFVVGILRAYGRLLGVSVDVLVAEVPGAPSVSRSGSAAPASRQAKASARQSQESRRQTGRTFRVGILMVVSALILAYGVPAAYWDEGLLQLHSLYDRLITRESPQVSDTTSPSTPAGGSAVSTVASQEQTGVGTLELKFDGASWVEVRDFSGRIIYSQLNAAGSSQFITGAAPLDVMVGNARQVQARWRDEPVALDKLSSDDVARIVLR